MASIYDYMDYRCFLKDRFSQLREQNSSFSYRYFNQRAGIKSSGFLKLVMDAKRNLAEEGIYKVSKGLKLNSDESRYFETLVKFNQAKKHEAKDHYFKELTKHGKFLAAKPLSSAQYRLFSHWYYVAILELVRIETREKKDGLWLRRKIRPEIGIRDLKKAIKELILLGLLKESSSVGLIRYDAMLSTPDEVQNISITNFHMQMCQLARQAILDQRPHEREFSGLTVAVSKQTYQRAKEEIQSFRKRLHSILEQEGQGKKEIIGHVNLQLFQLNKVGDE